MAQYDVYKNVNAQTQNHIPFLLDIQSDHMSALATRLVVPLKKQDLFEQRAVGKVHPKVLIGSVPVYAVVSEMAAVPAGILGEYVTSLQHERSTILAAVDLIVTGF